MDSPARPSQAKMVSSTGGTEGSSPASSPASASSLATMAAPKFGTLVPNRIFVGGIAASTSEAELAQLFSAYGNVKATKIIADRGGVSKGYGFVTFETEEEAKRLQQESECIVLKERKLNIAPAIKKQPFSRSFDGGTGSPPTVPTSTYYYTNGMGLPYPNGMTFYNTGAPGPSAAIAAPTDPATLYQAAGVFGPQATTSHQTFAPVMYPVPAPSLYMPQQYQYSPIPYEPYFPGTTAAGGPQFLYATNGAQATSGSGNGSGTSSSGTAAGSGAGATSPPSAAPSLGPSPPQFQTHFYGPAAATAASHHHPGAMTGGPHGLHPPPPHAQMEHLYYSYPPSPHAAQPPPHHGGPLALAADQQLLIYSTEISGQSSASDSQFNHQEDTRSTSSHSEQLHHGGTATSDSGGGGGGGSGGGSGAHSVDQSIPSMFPLMPLKYPLSHRYANFHPIAMHSNFQQQQQQQGQQSNSSQQQHQQQQQQQTGDGGGSVSSEEHHRAVPLYPTPLYLPQNAQYHSSGGSLLPTPSQQPYDLGIGSCKLRDYAKPGLATGTTLLHRPGPCFKQYGASGPQSSAHAPLSSPHHKYPRVATPPARLSHQHYGRRAATASQPQPQLSSTAYYFQQKPCQYGTTGPRAGQRLVYGAQPAQLSAYALHPLQKGFALTAGYEYADTGRRAPEMSARQAGGRKSAILNSYRGSNLTIGGAAPVRAARVVEPAEVVATVTVTSTAITSPIATTAATTPTSTTSSTSCNNASSEIDAKAVPPNSSESPPPASYSPVTHPLPNLSPSPNPKQVQFFGSSGGGGGGSGGGQRYSNPSSSSISQQQQQQQQLLRSGNAGGRYATTSSTRGGKTSSVLRQPSAGPAKYKMNGIVQSSGGKLPIDEGNLGGAGDAPPVGRLPITPPGTPQETSGETDQHLSDACRHMQTLNL